MTREVILHRLHEAAELEHSLMCTYLYAAFSLRQGAAEGLQGSGARATARWRRLIVETAIEEMCHLALVWNLTSALGGTPHFGRANFPTDPGILPASIVLKLAPFGPSAVQHFLHLERPRDSLEVDAVGYEPDFVFARGATRDGLTPMSVDYATVGLLYSTIGDNLRAFVAEHGELATFVGDPGLQLGPSQVALDGLSPIDGLSSALAALVSIVEQGEGSSSHRADCHYARFARIRDELRALQLAQPGFDPAFPAATNPALRRPIHPGGRVWIGDETAWRTVDIANACYGLMLRMLSHTYVLGREQARKSVVARLAVSLMQVVTLLGERAARLPAGQSHPDCNAGMSFTALRDASPLVPGPAASTYFVERLREIEAAVNGQDRDDPRVAAAARILTELTRKATVGLARGA